MAQFAREEALELGKKEGLELGKKEGLELGKKEGLEQGKIEGKIESARETILDYIQMRFPDSQLIALAEAQMAKMQDLERLQSVTRQVFAAQTASEIQAILAGHA